MACSKCKKKGGRVCEKGNPGEKICKQCCISNNGHFCNWFKLCW